MPSFPLGNAKLSRRTTVQVRVGSCQAFPLGTERKGAAVGDDRLASIGNEVDMAADPGVNLRI